MLQICNDMIRSLKMPLLAMVMQGTATTGTLQQRYRFGPIRLPNERFPSTTKNETSFGLVQLTLLAHNCGWVFAAYQNDVNNLLIPFRNASRHFKFRRPGRLAWKKNVNRATSPPNSLSKPLPMNSVHTMQV